MTDDAPVAQWIERPPSKREVAGSTPAERAICPVCSKLFHHPDDMAQHLTNKPGHIEWIHRELASLRGEVAMLKEAVSAWRKLARERAANRQATSEDQQ